MARGSMAAPLALALALLGMCAGAQAYAPPTSCADYISQSANTTLIAKLLTDAGLMDSLGPDFTGTVFIPWDKAITDSSKKLSKLRPEDIKNLLLFHASMTRPMPSDFKKMRNIESLLPTFLLTLGYKAPSSKSLKKDPTAQGSNMVENGNILAVRTVGACKAYLIDAVLIPDAKKNAAKVLDIKSVISTRPELSGIKAILEQADLLTTFDQAFEGNVFLPSNAALEAAKPVLEAMSPAELTRVLLYHVGNKPLTSDNFTSIPSTYYTIQGLTQKLGQVSASSGKKKSSSVPSVNNITISNNFAVGTGTAFVIEGVLVPKPARTASILECAVKNGDAKIATGLVARFPELLSKLGKDFVGSMFLPRDTAFDGVDTNAMSAEQLQAIIKYHISEGKVLRGSDFTRNGKDVQTLLDGASLRLSKTIPEDPLATPELKVNDITVFDDPDFGISSSCGFSNLYLINTILMPPSA